MDFQDLRECIHLEVIGERRKFTWRKVITRVMRHRRVRYVFWWRIAKYCHEKGGAWTKFAAKIDRMILDRYDVKIPLTVDIDKGLDIAYLTGVVIGHRVKIGKNFSVKPGVTIGLRGSFEEMDIRIGDNVTIGCNASILGGKVRIGDNVTIGAHAWVMHDVPEDSIFITKFQSEIFPKKPEM